MAIKVKVKPGKGKGKPVKIKQRISVSPYVGDEAQRLDMKVDSLSKENTKLLKQIDSLKVEIKIKNGKK